MIPHDLTAYAMSWKMLFNVPCGSIGARLFMPLMALPISYGLNYSYMPAFYLMAVAMSEKRVETVSVLVGILLLSQKFYMSLFTIS